jgi:hypothetical protein
MGFVIFTQATPERLVSGASFAVFAQQNSGETAREQRVSSLFLDRRAIGSLGIPRRTRPRWLKICDKNSEKRGPSHDTALG